MQFWATFHIKYLGCMCAILLLASKAPAQTTMPAIEHPALFLVGDSIMQTGSADGRTGPRGWGSEIAPYFDESKIHVYNMARGGRTGREFIAEGAWEKVVAELQPGDFVLVGFAHNESANSASHPDRISFKSNDDDTHEVEDNLTHKKFTVYSFGHYLRLYVTDIKAKGATAIIGSPVPRNNWQDGKIVRGFDGYADLARQAAQQSGAEFIDLNSLAADRFDAIGQDKIAPYYNDRQHTTKLGAEENAQAVVTGIRQMKDSPLAAALAAVPATQPVAVSDARQ